MPKLRIEKGFYAGLEWPLDRASTVVGRGKNADMILSEPTISRAHALVSFDGPHLYLQDIGSTNGTLVNGVKEERAILHDGDELRMGKLVLTVMIDGSDEVA